MQARSFDFVRLTHFAQDDKTVTMNKSLIILPIACLVLFGAGCDRLQLDKNIISPTSTSQTRTVVAPDSIPKEITIFVSKTCPHCAYVESQVDNESIARALSITFKEVSGDANLREFVEKAKTCKLDMSNLGVPLLWNGSSCYSGQDEIMTYISQLMKIYALRHGSGQAK